MTELPQRLKTASPHITSGFKADSLSHITFSAFFKKNIYQCFKSHNFTLKFGLSTLFEKWKNLATWSPHFLIAMGSGA